MARAKSNEQGRIKSKAAAIDEVTRGIDKLKDLMAQIEDLSREGFPYQDAVRARTELSLRETIRRIFGEKSEEYQMHKGHKLRTNHHAEYPPTIAILKQLVARLEQQKSDLLGVKPTQAESSAPPRRLSEPSSLPTASVPGPSETVNDKSIVTTDASQGSPPPSFPTAATALNGSKTSPDPESIARQTSTCSQVAPPGDPVASHVSVPREPAGPDPSTARAEVLTAQSTTEAVCSGPTAPHPLEAAVAAPPTVLLASIEAAHQLATRPSIADSEHVAALPQTSPTSELRTESARETSPVPDLFAVTRPANENPIARVSDEGSRPAVGSSAGTATGNHEAQPPTMSPAPAPKQMRDFGSPVPSADDPMAALRKVCTRFHLIARQLRLRRDYRPTLEVEDEYDVQDLLYALLRLEFEEVGSEDWHPAYGEGATRTSYLLHKDRVVIVAKKTKAGVTAKELVEQVKLDCSHYSGRTDCRTLVCFIYDPEGRIGNPRGLESDLTMVSDAFTLEVIIAPK